VSPYLVRKIKIEGPRLKAEGRGWRNIESVFDEC
jgi:hypothetical protein